MKNLASLSLLLVLLDACATAPRTSTAEERQAAYNTLLTVETALIVMHANGTVAPEDFQRATQTLGDLRTAIAESETKPFDWGSLMLQVANVAARWIAPVPVQPGEEAP